jgi:AcrR family transcriptional regulator
VAVTSGITGRRLEPEARRAQLIELGLAQLQAHGELSALDRISEAAGISRGLLFHYFPSKRDFRVAVVRAAADMLLAVTDPDPDLEPLQRLHAGLSNYVDFVTSNQWLYHALLRGAGGADDELQAIFDATRARIVERVMDGLGLVEQTPAVRASLRGWVGFVEESTLEWLRRSDMPRADLVRVQEQTLVRIVEIVAELQA